ncbi:MAG: carboxypeptidase regulatory-like domain-containing protein [Candidatus Kapabacteria bacterium]|nr:carboxypeptidase regulatory-like domain-containing protein [Candidatus Kapabacteria bacterium]
MNTHIIVVFFRISIYVIVIFSLIGCPDKDSPVTPNGDGDAMEFTGLVRYPVSSVTDVIIRDTVHGLQLKVVGGGNGEISIEKASKVAYPAPDTMPVFRIGNPQNMRLQLLVSHKSGETSSVVVCAEPFGSTYESTSRTKEWLGIPRTDTTSNPAAYDLSVPTSRIASKGNTLQFVPILIIGVVTYAKLTERAIYLNKCIELIRSNVQTIIDPIASPYKEDAIKEINGRLMPKADLAIISGVSYYNPFYSPMGLYVNPHFCFVYKKSERALKSTVAHETGHYISHVLLGDEKMKTIQANAIRNHDIGDVHPNRVLTEEYSQFADLTANGTIKEIPLADLYTNIRGRHSPTTVDFVTKEGYVTMLLGWLHSSSGIIDNLPDGSNTAGEDKDLIPSLQSSYGELWTMLAKHKPLTADDLYNAFKATYTPDQMKIVHTIMQRTGWTYTLQGTLTWTTGEPVKNVVVQPIIKIGSAVYTAKEDTTDENGKFTLPRGFPVADVQLRIKLSQKTILPDLDTIIPLTAFTPARKTNEPLNLGSIAITPPVIPPVFGRWEVGTIITQTPSCTPCGAANESFPLSLGGKYYLNVDGQGYAVFAGGNSNIVDYESAEISGSITVNPDYRYLNDSRYLINLSYTYRRDYANAVLKVAGAITSSKSSQPRYRGSLQFTVWEDQRKLKEVCNCTENVDAFSAVGKLR